MNNEKDPAKFSNRIEKHENEKIKVTDIRE